MRVAVVILHFGDISVTKKCITSLFQNETNPFSLIVVNNTEDVYKPSDFTKKNITLINNKKNLGFAGGVNVGIRYALKKGYDAICLLNNDTTISKPILKQLETALSEKTIGIVGPAIRFKKDNKTLYDMGGKLNKLFLRVSHTEVQKIHNRNSHVVSHVSGCCMVIKKEVFKKSGLFDDSFFFYYEDVDFCLRAREKGFLTKVVPSVVIDHALSKSAGKMSSFAIYQLTRGSIIFGKKYAKDPLQKIMHRLFVLFQSILFLKANPSVGISITKALLNT